MEYKNLNEVSEKIRHLYTEEVRNEQSLDEQGNVILIDESYTFLDENNIQQTGIRKVPKMVDNIYVVENSRNDLKSWEDVNAVIINSRGNKDNIVDHFIGKAIENDKWEFRDRWIDWNKQLNNFQSMKDNYVSIEDIEDPNFDEMISNHKLKEPIETIETISNWKLDNYDKLRKAAYKRWDNQFEEQFDGTWEDEIDKIKLKYPKK